MFLNYLKELNRNGNVFRVLFNSVKRCVVIFESNRLFYARRSAGVSGWQDGWLTLKASISSKV